MFIYKKSKRKSEKFRKKTNVFAEVKRNVTKQSPYIKMARKEANPQRKKERKRCNEQTQRKGEEGEETTLQLVSKDRAVSIPPVPPSQSRVCKETPSSSFFLVGSHPFARPIQEI